VAGDLAVDHDRPDVRGLVGEHNPPVAEMLVASRGGSAAISTDAGSACCS